MKIIGFILFVVAGLYVAGPVHAQTSLSAINARLDQLIVAGQFSEAFELAKENADELEGDTDFDFLYGVAAIESGNPNEAVFAFERVATTAESATARGRARLELARAYYLTNNLIAAEGLFNQVLASNPPQNVRENILAYLVIIDSNKRTQESTLTWTISGAGGYDDNINSATSDGLVETPLIGQIELNPDGQKTSDEFSDLNLGMAYRRFITRDKSLDFNLNFNQRNNFSTDQFDLDIVRGDVSWNHGNPQHRFRYTVQTQQVQLDGSRFQQSAGVSAAWQRTYNNGWYQTLTGSMMAIRYDNATSPSNDLRDVNQKMLALGLSKPGTRFTNTTNFYYADEDAVRSPGEHNGRNYFGVAHNILWRLNNIHTPYARINLQKIEYGARHPVFFDTTRSDTTAAASVGWLWQFNRSLLISGEVNYTDADSNITIFDYSRTRAQAGFNYKF